MKEKFITLLTVASGLKGFGLKFIRVAILVVFVWIGGLKYFHYEADGIVPFVANSPFMSFFYAKDAPEYKEHKNPEGAYVPANREWHEANRTYTFSYGLGAFDYVHRYPGILRHLLPQSGAYRRHTGHHHDTRYTLLPGDHSRSLGSEPGKRRVWLPAPIRCRTSGN